MKRKSEGFSMKKINRNEYIQYIADHLYESLMYKQHMKLEAL